MIMSDPIEFGLVRQITVDFGTGGGPNAPGTSFAMLDNGNPILASVSGIGEVSVPVEPNLAAPVENYIVAQLGNLSCVIPVQVLPTGTDMSAFVVGPVDITVSPFLVASFALESTGDDNTGLFQYGTVATEHRDATPNWAYVTWSNMDIVSPLAGSAVPDSVVFVPQGQDLSAASVKGIYATGAGVNFSSSDPARNVSLSQSDLADLFPNGRPYIFEARSANLSQASFADYGPFLLGSDGIPYHYGRFGNGTITGGVYGPAQATIEYSLPAPSLMNNTDWAIPGMLYLTMLGIDTATKVNGQPCDGLALWDETNNRLLYTFEPLDIWYGTAVVRTDSMPTGIVDIGVRATAAGQYGPTQATATGVQITGATSFTNLRYVVQLSNRAIHFYWDETAQAAIGYKNFRMVRDGETIDRSGQGSSGPGTFPDFGNAVGVQFFENDFPGLYHLSMHTSPARWSRKYQALFTSGGGRPPSDRNLYPFADITLPLQ